MEEEHTFIVTVPVPSWADTPEKVYRYKLLLEKMLRKKVEEAVFQLRMYGKVGAHPKGLLVYYTEKNHD